MNINTKDRKLILFDEEKEKVWSGPFFFIQGADSQFGLISRYIRHDPVVDWNDEINLSKAIVERVNKMNPPPRFFVICGDLVDAFPGQSLRSAQVQDFKEIYGKVRKDIPLLCVCGNHDIGDKPTKENVETYRSTYGDEYYSFLCGGVLFLVINSQYMFDDSLVKDIAEEQDEWIEKSLVTSKEMGIKRIIVFQHIPWFLKEFDEPKDEYFNLSQSLREKWLPKFKAAGVVGIFCGHYHKNAGGVYDGMPIVVTSAIGAQLGSDVSGARVVKVLENKIEHEYHSIGDLPLEVSFSSSQKVI